MFNSVRQCNISPTVCFLIKSYMNQWLFHISWWWIFEQNKWKVTNVHRFWFQVFPIQLALLDCSKNDNHLAQKVSVILLPLYVHSTKHGQTNGAIYQCFWINAPTDSSDSQPGPISQEMSQPSATWNLPENCLSRTPYISPGGQWVNHHSTMKLHGHKIMQCP